MKQDSSPTPIYIFGFTSTLLVLIPVIIPYFESFGLTMKEIYELNAFFGLSIAVCEIPSGYVADLWGRKKSLQLGSLITGVCFSTLSWLNSYWDFVIFEVGLGIGFSLISGTDVSLLYDYFKPNNSPEDLERLEEQRAHAFAHLKFLKMAGESFAALITIVCTLSSLSTVMIAQGICGWCMLISTFWIKESVLSEDSISLTTSSYSVLKPRTHKQNWIQIKRILFQNNSLFKLVFINYICWGLATFFSVWVLQKYWQISKISMVHFGWMWAGLNLFVGVVAKNAFWIQKKLGSTLTIGMIGFFVIAGYMGMGLLESLLGVMFSLCFYVSRGLNMVILHESLNRNIDATFRATLNSILSFTFRFIFLVLGPLFGWIIDVYGVHYALTGMGCIFIFFLFVLLIPLMSIFPSQKKSNI